MKKDKSFSYEGGGIDREHLPQLGVFLLITFGIPFIILKFFTFGSLFPTWPIWYFGVGFALGILVLLISFFVGGKKKDLQEEKKEKTMEKKDQNQDFPRPSEKPFPSNDQNQK